MCGDLRIAILGNCEDNLTGLLPHYNRRVWKNKFRRTVVKCQGINRHRPWDSCQYDKSFWGLF
jgi:hypothetical protein